MTMEKSHPLSVVKHGTRHVPCPGPGWLQPWLLSCPLSAVLLFVFPAHVGKQLCLRIFAHRCLSDLTACVSLGAIPFVTFPD